MKVRSALLLVLLLAPALQAKPDAEARGKAKIAKVWVEYARWCKLQDLKEESLAALERARALDPRAKDLDRLTQEADGLAGEGEKGATFEKRRGKAHKDAAKACDRLAKSLKGPRGEIFALEALALDPSKARVKKLGAAAQKGPTLIKHPDHPLVGYLSLPRGWKATRKCPVLVTVDGAGSNFLGSARKFSSGRGSRKFMVLAPCTLANTNQLNAKKYPYYDQALLDDHGSRRFEFDHEGLNKLLAFLQEHFGADEKFGITGFSGGGNLCYGMTAQHPDRILFAAPACANFNNMGFSGADEVEDGGPPIHIMTGDKDQHREWTHGKVGGVPGIEPQTDRAVAALTKLGYTNFRRTMLKGVGHSNCVRQVWEFCDEVVSGTRK